LVTDFYYPWIAGPAELIRNLATGLTDRGHEISVLAPSPTGRAYQENDNGFAVHRAASIQLPAGYQLRVSTRPFRDASRWLRATRPDVVHVHHPFPLCAAAILAGRALRIPVVATNHTIPACTLFGIRRSFVYGPAEFAFSHWLTWLLSRTDAVATPTNTAAAELRDLRYRGHVEVISNGVDTMRFQPGQSDRLRERLGLDGRPVVLYTGRLDAEKQMDVWLRSAARVLKTVPVQFVIGGEGTDRRRLELLAAELGLRGSVLFPGYLNASELPDLYRLANVYMITSPVELQSISLLEAIASGLPVVASRAGALPELVREGWNGYLAAAGNVDETSHALLKVLQANQAETRMMCLHSRQLAEQHGLAHTIQAYERFFSDRLQPEISFERSPA
ncbi:MAG: glycosyltransferase, partial [Chloroflexota bacterium]